MLDLSSVRDTSEFIVVVTGAGSGLGRAIALRLLMDGYYCVLAGLEKNDLEETLGLAGEYDSRSVVVECDVRSVEDRDRLMGSVAQLPGQLFGLVNNAGVSRGNPLLDESVQDWRDTMETNLESAFFLSQAAFELMRSHREGRVVNIGSIYGVLGLKNRTYGMRAPETTPDDRGPVYQPAYAASKGGLIQLTRSLAAAVGRWGITVNAISPGAIPWANQEPEMRPSSPRNSTTPKKPGLGDVISRDILAAITDEIPLQRLGRVRDVVGPVSFLLSDDAAYITGVNLLVDGGFTTW
ncbi:SDR family NAD(P)-dependent oxidoreductase [Haloechinothrix salitolerans]|uniref:SDR family NAD(P)-dependent oxidoreductase n=1 Tax=Haloechinothrix salitolerans TaxID=926830 RepID=A0ABW2BYL8_9PSEU